MLRLARIAAIMVLFISLAVRLRFPTRLAGRLNGASNQPAGKFLAMLLFMLVVPAKLIGGAFSPLFALAGAWAALTAARKADYLTAASGSLGALLFAHAQVRLRRTQQEFERTLDDTGTALVPKRPANAAQTQNRTRRIPVKTARCQRDIAYAISPITGMPLHANLWHPPVGVPASGLGLLYLHSSAWQALEYGLTMQPLLRWLAEQGHVVMDVGYTLAPQADLQDMLAEVRLAAAWIKNHAAELGVDPQRIALMGASGGGHLALLTAYSNDPGIAGVIACYAPTIMRLHFEEYGCMEPRQPRSSDLITDAMHPYLHNHSLLDRLLTRWRIFPAYRYQNLPGGALLLINLLGGTPDEVPEAFRLASPVSLAHKGCPPTLQIFGAHDFYFSAEHGRGLHNVLLECGAKSYYLELPYAEHGFDSVAWRISPPAQIAASTIRDFLRCLSG
jgi:acetyl esterase/lipase